MATTAYALIFGTQSIRAHYPRICLPIEKFYVNLEAVVAAREDNMGTWGSGCYAFHKRSL